MDLAVPSLGLDLDRDEGGCRADEEILLQRRIVPFIVIEFDIPALTSASPTTFS